MSAEVAIMASKKPTMDRRVFLSNHRDPAIASELMTYFPALRRRAQRLTRNQADADDLVQECVLRALSRIDQFEPGTNLRGWLSTILTNIFIERVRRAARYRELLATYALKHKMETAPNQLSRLEFLAVDKALDDLPDEQRAALLMIAVDQASYSETAQKAGVPLGTIRSRVSRARQTLMLSADGDKCTQPLRSKGPLAIGSSQEA